MRFPTHNAEWLHESNKLINFSKFAEVTERRCQALAFAFAFAFGSMTVTVEVGRAMGVGAGTGACPTLFSCSAPPPPPLGSARVQPIHSTPTSTAPPTHINHWIFGGQLPGEVNSTIHRSPLTADLSPPAHPSRQPEYFPYLAARE